MTTTISHLFTISIDANELLATSRKPSHMAIRKSLLKKEGAHSLFEALEQSGQRRDEILNARKHKLAQRYSHIQQVRFSKKNKEKETTAKQSERLSHLLKDAEEKRHLFLKERAQMNSQKVKRAQLIAQTNARKLAEESQRIKAELNQKLYLVTQRRQRLLTIPRSRLLEPHLLSDEDLIRLETVKIEASIIIQHWWREIRFNRSQSSPCSNISTHSQITKLSSALIIQAWWRRLKLLPLIKRFFSLNLTKKSASKMNVDRLILKIQQKSTLQTVSQLLTHLKKMIVNKSSRLWDSPARSFLSAYMVAFHPEETLNSKGTSETELSTSAMNMISIFESWLGGYNTLVTSNHHFVEFSGAINHFFTIFEQWKLKDTVILIEGMVSHWIQLERLWLSVRFTPNADSEWKPKLEIQQKQVYDKIAALGEFSLTKLHEAQKALIEEYEVEIKESETTTLVSSPAIQAKELVSTSPARFPSLSQQMTLNRYDSVNQPIESKDTHSDLASLNSNVLSLVSSFGSDLSHEYLAHELTLDPEFELKPKVLSPLEEQVKTMTKRSFFDMARQEFDQKEFSRFLPGLLEDIKKNLLAMVSESGSQSQEISQALDMPLIIQQIQHSAFDIKETLNWVVAKMLQLCAPVRDSSIRSLLQEQDLASFFEKTLELLENMKLDLMNYKLKSIRPALKQVSVEYEKEKFKAALSNPADPVSLDKTRAWLAENVDLLKSVAASRNPEQIASHNHILSFNDVYQESVLNYISSSAAINPMTSPETLLLDAQRLFNFQNEVQMLTVVSALLMIVKNVSGALRRNDMEIINLKNTITILLRSPGTSLDHLSVQLISTLQKHGGDLNFDPEMIKSRVNKTLNQKDPVYMLLKRRIIQSFKNHLSSGYFKRDSLVSNGIVEIGNELENLSGKIYIWANYNKLVYGEWYDSILKEMI